MRKFKCKICGFVYNPENGDTKHGIPSGTNFNELPEGWVCPICGAKKDKFIGENS